MKKQDSFFEKKKTTTAFAIIALTAGFLFLNKGITGNVILNNKASFTLLPLIGLLLVLCSLIIAVYTIKKNK